MSTELRRTRTASHTQRVEVVGMNRLLRCGRTQGKPSMVDSLSSAPSYRGSITILSGTR